MSQIEVQLPYDIAAVPEASSLWIWLVASGAVFLATIVVYFFMKNKKKLNNASPDLSTFQKFVKYIDAIHLSQEKVPSRKDLSGFIAEGTNWLRETYGLDLRYIDVTKIDSLVDQEILTKTYASLLRPVWHAAYQTIYEKKPEYFWDIVDVKTVEACKMWVAGQESKKVDPIDHEAQHGV